MSGDVEQAQPSVNGNAGNGASAQLDPVAIELATGLSLADIEALASDPPPDVRTGIAVKFAREFDRLAKSSPSKLAHQLLSAFSKDADKTVRMHFAESIKASPYLPPKIAKRLAEDDIDVAAPILRESPALDETAIGDVIRVTSEPHALVTAERQPLGASLVDLLIDQRGTKRVIMRLLDNHEADLTESALATLHDWGESDPDIKERLQRRPHLPFAFLDRCVSQLADDIGWSSLGERTMSKFEATQLNNRFEGKTGQRSSPRGERFGHLEQGLREDFVRGLLKPASLLTFLRDQDVDRLECGFSIMADLEVRWVRRLLYGSDKRALTALCLKAGFNTTDYLAFRIALGLIEIGSVSERQKQHYRKKTMKFAQDQFETMRANPKQLSSWLPAEAV